MQIKKFYSLLFTFSLIAQLAHSQFIYLNPRPNSIYRNPETSILLRSAEKILPQSISEKNLFNLEGSKSGYHSYSVKLADDGVNIILTPSAPFDFNEKVTVQVEDGIQTISGGHLKGLSFSFNTRRENSALEDR